MRRNRYRLSKLRPALAILALLSAGCATWSAQGLTPRALVASETPPQVRVTRTDSSRMTLDHPRVAGDSLRGFHDVAGIRGTRDSATVSVALDDIAYLSLKRHDGLGTVMAASWGSLAVLVTLLGVAISSSGGICCH